MLESHALIFADTKSLDSRAARKSMWYLYIYVLPMNSRVPDIGLMSEGGCK